MGSTPDLALCFLKARTATTICRSAGRAMARKGISALFFEIKNLEDRYEYKNIQDVRNLEK